MQVGYDFTLGLQKPIKNSNFYYGPELGLTSRGFQLEYEGSQWQYASEDGGLSHGVFISPINFGYQHKFTDKLALDAHVGLPISYYYYDGLPSGIGDEADGWDVNLKFGVGIWIKKFNVDLSYRYGFLETLGEGHSKNVMLGIGYRF